MQKQKLVDKIEYWMDNRMTIGDRVEIYLTVYHISPDTDLEETEKFNITQVVD